jgi:glycerol-3-phosphate dehydrogenase (NAD(P)+)
MSHITIIGAGAWGTALGLVAARAGAKVTLLTRSQMEGKESTVIMEHKAFPGLTFDKPLTLTANKEILRHQDLVVFAMPAQANREAAQFYGSYLPKGIPLVITAKGIEHKTLRLMSEVFEEELPSHPYAVLSGPNFAREIAQDLPAATTLATRSQAIMAPVLKAFTAPHFRPYMSNDVVGVQVSGAIKNVLAIAAGLATGAGFGENARAALISRGMAELIRLGQIKGGKLETFLGLAGYGDVLLTCTSPQSRNMYYGISLAQDKPVDNVLHEGALTAHTILALSQCHKIDMPICTMVHQVITKKISIKKAMEELLARPLKQEFGGE